MWSWKRLRQRVAQGEHLTIHISGMDCTSCSLSIDYELEALPGVISSTTNYASSKTEIIYNSQLASPHQFVQVIKDLGFVVTSTSPK